MTQAVLIKSKAYGIQLVLNPKLEFAQLTEAVIEKFRESGTFFKNAKLGISFEGKPLTTEQMYDLIAAIEAHTTASIICIMEDEQVSEACVMALTEAYIRERAANSAVCHYGSLKPGEDLHAETGIVIFGDVPRGAKVTAGGSIIIFGTLGGFAHAGMSDGPGDSAAYIAVLSIEAGQFQIGNVLYIPEAKEGKGKNKGGFLRRKKAEENPVPQIARVRDGHVKMEPYTKDLFQ